MNHSFLSKIGDSYKDFKVISSTKIEELDCYFKELIHEPTGAHVIHIENKDPENLFCLSFKTLPKNGRGAPHVLEHVVLCGSEKFPIKDPFFSMTRRSLNTFMNAFTGSDFTCYPAASQVETDFYNLLNVYLDAVFHPELKLNSFLQEGCRLEFKKEGDSSSPLTFKGIVYNEMKGSLTAESKLWHASLKALLPDLPYAHNSGGDPKEIPYLTHQELIEFHRTHYHPSRCLFFFYGSFPLKNHLDYIQEKTLLNVEPLHPLPPIPKQTRFKDPLKQTITYSPAVENSVESKTMVNFGWLTCSLAEQSEVLALSLLDSILMDTDASPLKKPLLQSGFCTQVEAHIDLEMSEIPYMIICKGCNELEVDQLDAFLKETLTSLSEHPFPKHLIEASIHQLELSKMEISGDHGPFGLSLFFRSALARQHGYDPKNMLKVHSLFKELLEKVQDPLYLPGILRKYLINNTHHVRITMIPDEALAQEELQEESDLLKSLKERLSPGELQKIIEQTQSLETLQKTIEEQNLDCLPKISLKDVPILPKDFPLKKHNQNSLQIFHHECFTNTFLYADFIFDLPAIEASEIPYLQLLLSILPELGAGNRNYDENLEYIMSHTGGISTSSSLHVQADNHKALKPALIIKGKCLERNVSKLFELMRDILVSPHFTDLKRLKELLKQIFSSLQNRVSKNALRYGIQLSLSGYSEATHFSHSSLGLPYYHFIEELSRNIETNLPILAEKLSELHQKLFSFHNPHLVLSCDRALYEKIVQENLFPFSSFPSKPFTPWKSLDLPSLIVSQGRIITSPVAYNVASYFVAPYIHPHAPALSIASQLFEHVTLHNKIREIGGAYGAGASYSSLTGCFYLYSYRDPHIANTFDVFDEAIETIALGKFNDRDIEEAKLSLIQQLDTPVSPGNQALLAYSWNRDGKTKALREEYRKKILDLSQFEIKTAIEKEFLNPKKEKIEISFASKDLLEKQGKKMSLFPL